MDASEFEEERPPAGRVRPPRNPYSRDPVLGSGDAVTEFLDTCDLTKVTVEANQVMKNICSCNKCSVVIELANTTKGTYEHLCCLQNKHWMEKFSESNVTCVTDCFAFSGVTNEYAVQNLLMLTWKFNKEKTIEAGQVLSNPPSNENMRFGNYKAPFTLFSLF